MQYLSGPRVSYVQHAGSDEMICQAARVSTVGAGSINTKESRGLLNYLMKNLHTSPFEHSQLTVLVSCPMDVRVEILRHRTFSFNETSGRYKTLEPRFYIPAFDRPLIQHGKAAHYTLSRGGEDQFDLVTEEFELQAQVAWQSYVRMLDAGIAREVARKVLPAHLYTDLYMTANVRNWLHFLALRTAEDAMYEIRQVAWEVDKLVNKYWPITHELFNTHERAGL